MAQTSNGDLMISISGVRGIVGRSLTPELVARWGQAFGTYMRSGRVVVGRDTRVSGEMVKHAVLGGLISTGCQVLDIGVVATPTATLMIEDLKAVGGVVISASHNPVEWNALKFFRADGIYLNQSEGYDLLNIFYNGDFLKKPWDQLKPVEIEQDAENQHVEKVLALLDVEKIRTRKFKVALDCCNGAGVGISLRLLRALGCQVEPIHCTPDGLFPHTPEPNFVNLQDLCHFTRERGADVGFATDPDADRIAVVSEDGAFLGEELSLALALKYILPKRKCEGQPVVINMSTSRVSEDVARSYGCPVVRTPVGEVNVAERMKELKAAFGGEGNGGVMDPLLHCGRDAIMGMGLVLEALAHENKKISAVASGLPRWHMIKSKLELPTAQSREIIRRLRAAAPEAKANTEDGLRLDWEDCWVHLRASNTEPVLRVIAEARTEAAAQELVDRYTREIKGLLST